MEPLNQARRLSHPQPRSSHPLHSKQVTIDIDGIFLVGSVGSSLRNHAPTQCAATLLTFSPNR